MTLESTTVPVLFEGALDQKKNYKAVMPGSFLTLQNAVRRKEALWEKRYGTTSLAKNYALPYANSPFNPSITSGVRLGAYDDNLVMLDGRNLWPYFPSANAFSVSQGVAAAVSWKNHQLMRSQWDTTSGDMAYCNGYVALAFYNGTYGPGYAIYDANTGACVLTPQTLPGVINQEVNLRVVAVGDYFLFAYWSGSGGTNLTVFNVHAPVGSAPVPGSNNSSLGISNTFGFFDLDAYDGTTAVLAIKNSAGTGISIAKITASNCTVAAQATFTATTPTVTGVGTVGSNIYLAYTNGSTIFAVAYNGALTAHSTAANLDVAAAFASYYNATFVPRQNAAPMHDSPGGTIVSVVFDGVVSGLGGNSGPQMQSTSFSWNGTNGSALSLGIDMTYGGLTLASKAFYGPDQSIYYYALSDTPLQPTYFLMRLDTIYLLPVCVAKFAASYASHMPSSGAPFLSRVTSDGTNFHTALRVITATDANVTQQVGFAPAPNPAVDGVDHYSVNLAGGDYVCKSLGRGLQMVSGGLVNYYDGVCTAEIGFHQFPEGITVTGQTTGGSLTVGATYYYRVMWEWVDNFGQVHRSCPSTIQSVALSGSNNKFTLSIPPLAVGSKDWRYVNSAHQASYRAVIYLAQHGDATLFYRHDVIAGSSMYVPGNTTTTLSIDIFDEPNTTNELLYTTGGIVENIAPPAARCAHVHKNRMWLGGLENSELWFSKEWIRGDGIAFSDIFRIPIETAGGDVTAFATLDDKLIIFKRDRLYFLVGDGPDNAGNNWDYPEPVHIPSDVGTVQPNTVVEIPGGIIFKSLKGWVLLNRGLQLSYIGDRVEDFNGNNACSATVIGTQNEVRFAHSNGDCLVYNYYFNQWSTFTNYLGVSTITANGGAFYRLTADGTTHKEVVGQYNDDGTTYSMTVETAWFQFRKIQGYQRIYDFELIGDFFSHHNLQVSVAYDFNSAYNQTVSYNTQTNGVTGPTLQLRIQPKVQKCSAMKIKIVDVDNIVAGGGATFKATALTFDLAGKQGSFKLPNSRQIG